MATGASAVIKTALILTVLVALVIEDVNARRGGGARGGSRSSSRSRYSGSSSRSSSSRSSSSGGYTRIQSRYGSLSGVRRYRGPMYKSSYWKTGMAVGMVYGLTSYKRRRRYISYPDKEPTICFNENNLKNGTYGFFICPEPDQPDDYNYCCGDDGNQKCCQYFEKEKEKAVTGIVIGVIAAVIAIGVIVFCCVKRHRGKRGVVLETNKGDVHDDFDDDDSDKKTAEAQPLQTDYTAPPVQMNTYNVQPTPLAQADYGVAPQPQGYAAPPPQPYDPNQAPPVGYADGYAPPPTGPAPIGFEGAEKPPLPPGDMSGGLPYTDKPQGPGYPVGAYPPPPTAPPQGMPPPYPAN